MVGVGGGWAAVAVMGGDGCGEWEWWPWVGGDGCGWVVVVMGNMSGMVVAMG